MKIIKALQSIKERIPISLLIFSIGFASWGAAFIRKSSFITVYYRRSYSLFDDAMISMRYAWNFSHGNGLVWNQGEYVQGYTNLLMTLLMSLATFVFSKTNAILFMQMTGIAFMLAIAYLNMKIAEIIFQKQDQQQHGFIKTVSFLGGFAYYPLAYWSLMGMETGLLAALLLASILSALRFTQTKNSKFLIYTAIYLSLAFLTRNDSAIFAGIIWAYLAWEVFREGKKKTAQLIASIFFYACVLAAQLGFQYLYYGEFMPNTYTLKMTGIPTLVHIQGGIGFIKFFLKETALLLIFSAASLVINFRKEKLLLLSMPWLSILYQIYVGGDPWAYWRIMAPTMPLVILLCMDTATALPFVLNKSGLANKSIRGTFLSVNNFLTLLIFLSGITAANFRFIPEIFLQKKPFQSAANAVNVNTAIVLNDILTNNGSVGVFWAGAISYYMDNKSIDFLGKSDKFIANLPADISGRISWLGMQSVPGHNKYDLTYSIISLKPTYVQQLDWGSQDITAWAEDQYIKIKYKGVYLYLLKNSPDVLWEKIVLP